MLDWLTSLTPPTGLSGSSLTAYVLFDIFLIILLAQLLGNFIARIGQPRVVGEILAGILLGPTLLGDNLSLVITPMQVRPVLAALATIGLILFMFLAGVEYDIGTIRGRGKQAGLLGLLSVCLPALLGFPLARVMYASQFADQTSGSILPFALLMGAALTVTAFPVMAHILMEQGELNTPLGSLAVATAAIISVSMFIYIAIAQATVEATGLGNLLTKIGLMILFGIISWSLIRPYLAKSVTTPLSKNSITIIFGGMVLFGFLADRLGLNSLVGGFMWGMILPTKPLLRQEVAAKVRDITLTMFLPLFFAYAGFSADMKLLTWETLPAALLVLLVAVASKFIAATPARLLGLTWKQVGTLGALFNTRGLLVLVVGLIGLQLNIFTESTFAITVFVALVTNLMTLPLLSAFQTKENNPAPQLPDI